MEVILEEILDDLPPGQSRNVEGGGRFPESSNRNTTHSVGCTCTRCICSDCPHPEKMKTPDLDSTVPSKSKICCCPGGCVCHPCTIEVLTKQLKDAQAQLANTSVPVAYPVPSSTPLIDTSDEKECSCPDCVCPGRNLVFGSKKPDGNGHPEDCTCPTCDCPFSNSAGGPLECICNDCESSSCAEPKRKDESAKPTDIPLDNDSCDCDLCDCNPCTDPNKAIPVTQPRSDRSIPHLSDCECEICKCPQGGAETKDIIPEPRRNPPHPPNCDCNICKCEDQIILTGSHGRLPTGKDIHPPGCRCIQCLCSECNHKTAHIPGCKCDECLCSPCTQKQLKDMKARDDSMMAGPKVQLGDEKCTCKECYCDSCSDPTKGKSERPKATEPVAHSDGCDCLECVCKDCLEKLEPLKHQGNCQCPQCVCIECLKQMTAQQKPLSPPMPVLKGDEKALGDNCICKTCMCINCAGVEENAPKRLADFPNSKEQVTDQETPPFEVPVRMACDCRPCICFICNQKDQIRNIADSQPKVVAAEDEDVFKSAETLILPKPDVHHYMHPPTCDCELCNCISCQGALKESRSEGFTQQLTKPLAGLPVVQKSAIPGEPISVSPCDCNKCQCNPCNDPNKTAAKGKVLGGVPSKVTTHVSAGHSFHLPGCECAQCTCNPCYSKMIDRQSGPSATQTNIKQMDAATLKQSLHAFNEENCKCKQQIGEIKRILNNIRCACTGAQLTSTCSPGKRSAIKQAPIFEQTISSLKMALTNLQEQCIAKERMIDAVTGELQMRGRYADEPKHDCPCPKSELKGFEVIDIRRVVGDNLIVKWSKADNGEIVGYDILVNGALSSKVMSGSRTSAMLDMGRWPQTGQITIYARNRCGRVEPPAVAIY